MRDADSWSGPPGADAIPLFQRPGFDANRHWYEEYIGMMQRANEVILEEVKALRYASALHEALCDVLNETAGGNFLSQQTRDRVQDLLRNRFVPSR